MRVAPGPYPSRGPGAFRQGRQLVPAIMEPVHWLPHPAGMEAHITPNPLLEHLYDALRADKGYVVRTTDVDTCIARLRYARDHARDPDLKALKFVKSVTTEGEVWIIKRESTDEVE